MTSSSPDPGTTGRASAGLPTLGSSASANETVFYEGGPAKGDLIFNLLFGLTPVSYTHLTLPTILLV